MTLVRAALPQGVDVYEPMRSRRPARTAMVVVATVLAACCAGGTTMALVGGALSDSTPLSATGATPGVAVPGAAADAAAQTTPGLNVAVRDGKFEFIVTSVSCGHESVGQSWLQAKARGQFCVVEVSVANIGAEAQRFADGHQKAFGPEGNMYAADTGAGVAANQSGDAVWNVVNPGISLRAKIVYDIPVTATIARVELHDSPLSGGVTVIVAESTT